MRRILILLSLGLAVTLQASAPSGSIDDFIDIEMPNSGAPGLAYAVIQDDEIQSKARGEIVVDSGRKVTSNTPFVIGSISKSFTAIAVMQLVEIEKVALDSPISQYLKAFSDQSSGIVTIRQLLSHTSGYSTLQGNTARSDMTSNEDILSQQVTQVAQWPLANKPGSSWEYSNANYQILGALIEEISGQDYASYIKTNILQPIGMDDSFVADGQSHDGMARGHQPWFGSKRAMGLGRTDRASAPQGGVIASANDVAKYLTVMMNGEDDIITAKSKASMLRPASDASPFYGFGWFLDVEKGTAFHSGSSPGVETLATMIPAERKAAVVLVNAGSGIGFGETIALRNGISAKTLGLDYNGEGSRLQQKILSITLALLPLTFLLSMIWALFHRAGLRAKTGPFGLFSLWFPLLTTLGMAWSFFYLIPQLFGVSIGTLRLFQPDLILTMIATAATGVIWALLRLGIAYSGKSNAALP